MSRPRVAVSLALLLAACADEVEVFDENVCTREVSRTIPYWQKPALDVLVVLDRSPSMADDAEKLAAFARTTSAVLETVEGGVPDLHLAVVTSDLGARDVAGCGAGDAAAFQGGARCGLDGAFLEARGLVAGGIGGNFTGTLADTLACLADVPLTTCPVSQPLGAALRAIDGTVPGNAGFRRDYAYLIVIVVTDNDDATSGAHGQLADVSALVAALADTMPEPKMLALSIVAPPPAAAPRLARASLPERTTRTCACDDDWSDVLHWFAELPKHPLIGLCLPPELDLDPTTLAFEVNCENRVVGAEGETVAPLPWCDAPGVDLSRPCIQLGEPDPGWCAPDGAARYSVSLGDTRLPDRILLELRCEIACEPDA